jgi:hypothetical protein
MMGVQGVWEVQDSTFEKKYDALVYATEINAPVNFNFFNDVWDNFDKKLLGTVPLQELYKQRAQQLRNKYDYLILYYSGGSDSYNILRTFLDNGIKIDEICVKWATKVLERERNIYTPNTEDTSAYNYLSEWDYAIKPVLDELAKTNPEIKIEIVNWMDDRFLKDPHAMFDFVNHWHDIELPSLATWSPSEAKLIAEGKTVGNIYGVDKPYVIFGEKETLMYFSDACTAMGPPNPINPTGVEFFYWAPDLPHLAWEMGYQTMLAQENNPALLDIKFSSKIKKDPVQWNANYQRQQKEMRYVLYDNWIDVFQTMKPEMMDRSDKHAWIYRDPELKEYRETFHRIMNERLADVGEYLLRRRHDTVMFKLIKTKAFVLRSK